MRHVKSHNQNLPQKISIHFRIELNKKINVNSFNFHNQNDSFFFASFFIWTLFFSLWNECFWFENYNCLSFRMDHFSIREIIHFISHSTAAATAWYAKTMKCFTFARVTLIEIVFWAEANEWRIYISRKSANVTQTATQPTVKHSHTHSAHTCWHRVNSLARI